jgi:hypothetical protein
MVSSNFAQRVCTRTRRPSHFLLRRRRRSLQTRRRYPFKLNRSLFSVSNTCTDIAAAAAAEMREEARLMGGRLLPLLRDNHPGALELKWSSTRFHCFLCIDPETDTSPPQRDAEEFIEVIDLNP